MSAARPMRPVSLAELLALPRRVALLRKPHQRFASTWRDYRRRRGVRLTFEGFADAAFIGGFPFKTPELLPQAASCAVANHLIRWDFDELSDVLGSQCPTSNRTEQEGSGLWPAAVEDKFAERYAADLALAHPPPGDHARRHIL